MKPAVQQTHPDSSIPDVLWSSVAEVQGSQTHGSLLLSNHCPNPKRALKAEGFNDKTFN
jgi:hypothetical protein